jgi:hypothetical protein
MLTEPGVIIAFKRSPIGGLIVLVVVVIGIVVVVLVGQGVQVGQGTVVVVVVKGPLIQQGNSDT